MLPLCQIGQLSAVPEKEAAFPSRLIWRQFANLVFNMSTQRYRTARRYGRGYNRQSMARLIAAVIMALVAAVFGHKHLGNNPKSTDPVPAELRGAGRPVDGDSLFVGRDEVRLKGIDAPEGRQTCTRDGRDWDCGNAARDALRRLIGNDVVVCRSVERDKHGRVLGYCTAGGRNLNAGMVASGMAVAYGGYNREEAEARAQKRGLWGSDFKSPRDWRHERGIGL